MSENAADFGMVGQIILYGGVAAGIIAVLYVVVTNLFGAGGAQAFISAYGDENQSYIVKMNGYARSNNGVLNQAQIDSMDFEQKQMKAKAAEAAPAFAGVIGFLEALIIPAAVAALVAYVVTLVFKNPDVVAKWKAIFQNPDTQPQSPEAAMTMFNCAIVDELAAEGYTVEATNFLSSIQSAWNVTTSPYMQQQITSLQNQINAGILTGIELDIATYFVQAYTFDLAMIPTVFTLPLVPL